VIVNFYNSILKYTHDEKSFECAGNITVRNLIAELGNHYGAGFAEFLSGENNCLILLNGKGLMTAQGLDTMLGANDKIDILPFISMG